MTRLALLMWGAAAVVYLALLFRPLELLMTRPFLEEAFYPLSRARAIAAGAGYPAGGLQATSAVSPSMSLVYAPAFWLTHGSTVTALRLCLLCQILLFGHASLAIGASLRGADREAASSTGWLVAALVFCNYTFSAAFLDGLETALVVALVFTTFAWYDRQLKDDSTLSFRNALVVGGLCGLCTLARTDAALFVAALAVWHTMRRTDPRNTPKPWQSRAMQSAVVLAIAGAAWATWWLVTDRFLGSTGASAQQPIQFYEAKSMSTRIATLRVLSNQCLGIVHLATRHDHVGTSNIAGLCLLMAAAGFVLAVPPLRSRARQAFLAWRKRWALGSLTPLWLYSAFLVIAYTMFYKVPHLQSHYLLVPRILLLFVLASFGTSFLQRFARGRILLLVALAAWGLLSLGLHVRDFSGAGGNVMLGPAEWLRLNTQPGQRVGMFQSGTTGFLYPDKVVNLDGNLDPEAVAAVRTHSLSGFLQTRNVQYLIDRREYLAFAWRDTALARRAVRVTTLANDLEVWSLKPQ